MTKIIGLTGGIGSGKTTVASFFSGAEIPVYIADHEAKLIMQSKSIIEEVKKSFGETVFQNGLIDKKKLSEIVFNDSEKLKELNSIVHPAVREHFETWLFTHRETSFVVYETALLFETGSYKRCDYIITVTAPIDLRIERVIQRDHTTKEEVLKRIEAQWDDEQRISKSNFVIENLDLKTTEIKVRELLCYLRANN